MDKWMLAVTRAWLLKCWLQIWTLLALLCWLSFLHVLLPYQVYKVLPLWFTKGWCRDYVNVTWSTDENCVEPVGHMLVTCCFVFLCAHCVHLVKLCIRTTSLRVHVRPCFHSCSSRVDTLYTLAPPSLLTCVWAAMKTFLPPHL